MRRREGKAGSWEELREVTASVDIAVPQQEVWNLFKPAENAVLFDPTMIRSFHVPGTPIGIGEIQGFISRRDGREQVQAVEIVDEVPGEYAITRTVGGEDNSARTSFFLRSTTVGTRLEMRSSFTLTRPYRSALRQIEEQHWQTLNSTLQRVKLIAETRWQRPPHAVPDP